MTIDITFVIEQRTAPGLWDRIDDPGTTAKRLVAPDEDRERTWTDGGNRELFEILGGPLCPRTLSPHTVIAEARGMPDDASAQTRAEFEAWGSEATSPSWLDVEDLLSFDWSRRLANTYHLEPPQTPSGTTRRRSRASKAQWDQALAHIAEHGVPPEGWQRAGGATHGVVVTGHPTCAQLAGNEFLSVIDRMAALATSDRHQVRCVFWFDQ